MSIPGTSRGTPTQPPHRQASQIPSTIWPPAKRPSERLVAAAVPYLVRGGVMHVVLVSDGTDNSQWGFPKGQSDALYAGPTSASKSALEKAGVLGTIDSRVVAIDQETVREDEFVTVHCFRLAVTEVLTDWPEMTRRMRRILPLAHARRILRSPVLNHAVGQLAALTSTTKPIS